MSHPLRDDEVLFYVLELEVRRGKGMVAARNADRFEPFVLVRVNGHRWSVTGHPSDENPEWNVRNRFTFLDQPADIQFTAMNQACSTASPGRTLGVGKLNCGDVFEELLSEIQEESDGSVDAAGERFSQEEVLDVPLLKNREPQGVLEVKASLRVLHPLRAQSKLDQLRAHKQLIEQSRQATTRALEETKDTSSEVKDMACGAEMRTDVAPDNASSESEDKDLEGARNLESSRSVSALERELEEMDEEMALLENERDEILANYEQQIVECETLTRRNNELVARVNELQAQQHKAEIAMQDKMEEAKRKLLYTESNCSKLILQNDISNQRVEALEEELMAEREKQRRMVEDEDEFEAEMIKLETEIRVHQNQIIELSTQHAEEISDLKDMVHHFAGTFHMDKSRLTVARFCDKVDKVAKERESAVSRGRVQSGDKERKAKKPCEKCPILQAALDEARQQVRAREEDLADFSEEVVALKKAMKTLMTRTPDFKSNSEQVHDCFSDTIEERTQLQESENSLREELSSVQEERDEAQSLLTRTQGRARDLKEWIDTVTEEKTRAENRCFQLHHELKDKQALLAEAASNVRRLQAQVDALRAKKSVRDARAKRAENQSRAAKQLVVAAKALLEKAADMNNILAEFPEFSEDSKGAEDLQEWEPKQTRSDDVQVDVQDHNEGVDEDVEVHADGDEDNPSDDECKALHPPPTLLPGLEQEDAKPRDETEDGKEDSNAPMDREDNSTAASDPYTDGFHKPLA